MPETITVKTEYEPGYVITTDESGNRTKLPIADVLRAADIPAGLTYAQVQAITPLANLIADLTKKLIALEVLPAEFTGEDGYDLEAVVQTIENMGGDFGEPDLSVE